MASDLVDIRAMVEKASDFQRRIEQIKRQTRCDFDWYPYHSLGNFAIFERLLGGGRRRLLELIAEEPVLDLGCADGEVGFFFASLGCRVHAVDYPPTSHNGLRGARRLKDALGSGVEIFEADLDAHFEPPGARYGLALALGILYHLKSPFALLETLGRGARYCLLSTRVARFTPDWNIDYRHAPMAYLVDDRELNEDSSNYWIFSEAGLWRLLKRTGWEPIDWLTIGNEQSDPVTLGGDQRVYCLARSRAAEPVTIGDLAGGWHGLEEGSWRWTAREFSVMFRHWVEPGGARLTMSFALPEAVLSKTGPVRLEAAVNGGSLPPQTYATAGMHAYSTPVPAECIADGATRVDFRLDRALPADAADQRERGLVVTRVALE
jgi:hypothetical protein